MEITNGDGFLPSNSFKVVLKISRIVVRDENRLKGREICQHYPVPCSAHNIIWCNITMCNVQTEKFNEKRIDFECCGDGFKLLPMTCF